MGKILVFDTETTDITPIFNDSLSYKERNDISNGLDCKDWDTAITYWNTWINKWPHIIQLSYIVYDTEYPKKSKIFNEYVNLEKDIQISNKASELTHIYKSHEDAINKCVNPKSTNIYLLDKLAGCSIVEIIDKFMQDFNDCDYVVAHNADFDKKMILSELKRLCKYDEMKTLFNSTKFVCTMKKTIPICKIIGTYKNGNTYFKYPTLLEAYEKITGNKIEKNSLHNALIDVVMCLRIFCKLGDPYNIEIYGKNKEITKIIDIITLRRKSPRFISI